jgi:hypothetical protein
MKEKLVKYIWVALCVGLAIYHVALLVAGGVHNTGLSVINIAYIMIFATAIIRELNFSKALFYVMLAMSLLSLVYGLCFTPSFF